jgi:hypothetical protein
MLGTLLSLVIIITFSSKTSLFCFFKEELQVLGKHLFSRMGFGHSANAVLAVLSDHFLEGFE